MTNSVVRFVIEEIKKVLGWKEAIALIEGQEELIRKQGKLNKNMIILIRELERQRDTVLVQRNKAIQRLAEATGRQQTFARRRDENI